MFFFVGWVPSWLFFLRFRAVFAMLGMKIPRSLPTSIQSSRNTKKTSFRSRVLLWFLFFQAPPRNSKSEISLREQEKFEIDRHIVSQHSPIVFFPFRSSPKAPRHTHMRKKLLRGTPYQHWGMGFPRETKINMGKHWTPQKKTQNFLKRIENMSRFRVFQASGLKFSLGFKNWARARTLWM